MYSTYRYQPVAFAIGGDRLPGQATVENLTRLAEPFGFGAQWTADVVAETAASLRRAWFGGIRHEARARFEALADHYERRLDTLPLLRGA